MHRKLQASSEVDIPTWNFFTLPVFCQFEGAEELLHSLHALFGLLVRPIPRGIVPKPQASVGSCSAAGTDSAHDNLREHRTLLLKAPIGLRAKKMADATSTANCSL